MVETRLRENRRAGQTDRVRRQAKLSAYPCSETPCVYRVVQKYLHI